MQFPTDATPEDLMQFAREAVWDFINNNDEQAKSIAHRSVLRASKFLTNSPYWVDRFSANIQELELAMLAGGNFPVFLAACHETLDAMDRQLVAEQISKLN